jgi:hypothetical protein
MSSLEGALLHQFRGEIDGKSTMVEPDVVVIKLECLVRTGPVSCLAGTRPLEFLGLSKLEISSYDISTKSPGYKGRRSGGGERGMYGMRVCGK